MMHPTVTPMLSYRDGPRAMDWLADAFGFVEQTRWLGDGGTLSHGEMRVGRDGLIMLATPDPGYEGPAEHRKHCESTDALLRSPWVIDGVHVYVDDLDAHYARAAAAGAHLLSGVEDTEHGRLYRVEDLEGHRWMFMQATA
jgi:PhnB protein